MSAFYCLSCLPLLEDDEILWGDEFDFWAPPVGTKRLSTEEWPRELEAVAKELYGLHYQKVTKAILDKEL